MSVLWSCCRIISTEAKDYDRAPASVFSVANVCSQFAVMMSLYCSQRHENSPGNRFCVKCGKPLVAVGQILENRYRIVRQLGQGGFGCAFLAEDMNHSSQSCVLKEFAPQDQLASQRQKAKELFEREAHVLHQLQHRQIPRFREMLQVNLGGELHQFLVQDYVEGETYSHLLEARKLQELSFSEVEVRQILCQILPVLSYIHSLNVIHRDISPDNLIQRSSDHLPVLIDFGGVKQLSATPVFWFTQLGLIRTRLGKKGYAPEEQLLQGKVFPNSDLYALAVTALVLLTGKEPQALYDSYKGTWLWGREINAPPHLETVLKKMLAYKPIDRYQSAEEVLQALHSQTTSPLPNPNSQMRTVNFLGRKPDSNSSYSHQNGNTPVIATSTLDSRCQRLLAVRVASASLVVLTGMGAWTLINSVVLLPQSMRLPQQRTESEEKTWIDLLFRRRQALAIKQRIFNVLVNAQFYQSHPSVRGRSLKNEPEDANLRQEWDRSADELLNQLEKAHLTAAARGRLGSYSQQDYETWKGQANRGQVGNYTIEQLERQTDEIFEQLFPQQRDEKRNLQTFGQIWYAILSDKVSQIEIGK